MNDLIERQAALDALESIGSLDTEADRKYARGIFNALPSAQPEPLQITTDYAPTADELERIKQAMRNTPVMLLPSAEPVLDRAKISDLLEKIYSIQSVHLSVEGVLARKYYCKQLWMELFGSEDVPTWMN